MRRRCYIRVIPVQGAFLVDLQVIKELEDLPQPTMAVNGLALFNMRDQGVDRVADPLPSLAESAGRAAASAGSRRGLDSARARRSAGASDVGEDSSPLGAVRGTGVHRSRRNLRSAADAVVDHPRLLERH